MRSLFWFMQTDYRTRHPLNDWRLKLLCLWLFNVYRMEAWTRFPGWTCSWWIPPRWWWWARSRGRRFPSASCWSSKWPSTRREDPEKYRLVLLKKLPYSHSILYFWYYLIFKFNDFTQLTVILIYLYKCLRPKI